MLHLSVKRPFNIEGQAIASGKHHGSSYATDPATARGRFYLKRKVIVAAFNGIGTDHPSIASAFRRLKHKTQVFITKQIISARA
jgi:hypothetical protein